MSDFEIRLDKGYAPFHWDRNGKSWVDLGVPPRWLVSLPHRCDSWVIGGLRELVKFAGDAKDAAAEMATQEFDRRAELASLVATYEQQCKNIIERFGPPGSGTPVGACIENPHYESVGGE